MINLGKVAIISTFVACLSVTFATSEALALPHSSVPKQLFIVNGAMMQMEQFEGDSVWTDGYWDETSGVSGQRYLLTYLSRTTAIPVIQVLNFGVPNYNIKPFFLVDCPRKIGHIGITSVGRSHGSPWYLVRFDSTSGVTGSVNLLTHHWTFHPSKNSTVWRSIDPIKPLNTDMFKGTWIDGDWHSAHGFGQRFVSPGVNRTGARAFIQVQYNNRGALDRYFYSRGPLIQDYPAPNGKGVFAITGFSDKGDVVHITFKSGIHGTFNLNTHRWLMFHGR